jgi:PIF1-like helicase/Helix-turn-helix domain/HRDC domain/UvrD-like helicase C-terminal domain
MDTVTNQDLQFAFDFIKYTNRNIFLTGKAGTGKTTFLRDLKKLSPKRMIVVAPTGVAAINAGGVTIHSFFQLPFHPYVPSLYLSENNPQKQPEQKDFTGYKMSREKVNIIKGLDLLIIDEISMVRADTLDAIDYALRRYKIHHLSFGGVQLLMIGDLQQLAPVVRDEDREIINKYYNSSFFFGSRALSSTDYVTIELKHIYRQKDQAFINLLNKVRDNQVDSDVLSELNKRYIPDFDLDSDGGYITLTTHNYQAQMLNDSKLDKLPGRAHSFKAIINDEFPEFSYPTACELILKEGAQVMFAKNDISRDKLFFNGKIGKVEAFEDDIIVVKCPDDDFPIRVEMAEWQNMKYTLDDETKEIQETVIGTFKQYPLKLAWAITIHKSQGLTFDRAVIDANIAFAHGQVYVALSRCRTLDGLVLSTRINQRSIIDDPAISDFIHKTIQNRPGEKQLEDSKKAYQQILLTELFDFTPLSRNLGYGLKIVNEHHDTIIGDLQEMLENGLNNIRTDLIEVSEKFRPQLNGLFSREIDAESNILLQERVKKASEFFSIKLEAALKGILAGFSVETDNKTVRKSVSEALERIRKEGITKLACLNTIRSGFTISKYLDAKAKSTIDIPSVKSHSAKSVEDTSGIIKHPALFHQLKEWRITKAIEMKLPHYMILPQKTMVTLVNFIPQSMPALNLIKGMGKKKSEKFGEELLNIIISYCQKEKIEPPAETLTEKIIPKKIEEETKKISYDLFKEGKAISEIAEERKLSINTIEGHLAYYVGTGEIPINKFVSREITDQIVSHFEGKDDLKIGPVKEALGEKASWSDIKFVASHLRFLKMNKELHF